MSLVPLWIRLKLTDNWFLDMVAVHHRMQYPINGLYYTWADDVENLRRRDEEYYVPAHRRPASWSPMRCKGWTEKNTRPCRNRVAQNVEGVWLDFCVFHEPMLHQVNAKSRIIGTMKRTRHAAYSEVLRLQMIEAVKMRNDERATEAQQEMARDLDVMDALDVEDPVSGLKEMMTIVQTLVARMTRQFYAGKLDQHSYMQGVIVFAEMQRKLLSTRHELSGSASDEMKEAIDTALADLGLKDDDGNDEVLGGIERGELQEWGSSDDDTAELREETDAAELFG